VFVRLNRLSLVDVFLDSSHSLAYLGKFVYKIIDLFFYFLAFVVGLRSQLNQQIVNVYFDLPNSSCVSVESVFVRLNRLSLVDVFLHSSHSHAYLGKFVYKIIHLLRDRFTIVIKSLRHSLIRAKTKNQERRERRRVNSSYNGGKLSIDHKAGCGICTQAAVGGLHNRYPSLLSDLAQLKCRW
jgi:hypothetical protein